MEHISGVIHRSFANKLKNSYTGEFCNKAVTRVIKNKYIDLKDRVITIKKNSNKLSSRLITVLKTTNKVINKDKKNFNIIENTKLASIYKECMKTTNNLKISKILDTFLQTINTEYSETNLPTKSQQQQLYSAYLDMAAHYLAVKPAIHNNKLGNLLYKGKIQANSKSFLELVYCSIETKNFLKNNMNDPTYISAQMQQLTGKGCFTTQDNNFIYGKCLTIYNHPEPRQALVKLQKKRFALSIKDTSTEKTAKLAEIDNEIKTIKLQLKHIKHENLATQKVFLKNVFAKRTEITNKKLDAMILLHIKKMHPSKRDINKITDNIMKIINKDIKALKDHNLVEDVIATRVATILNNLNENHG